jgi:hypothetical protein
MNCRYSRAQVLGFNIGNHLRDLVQLSDVHLITTNMDVQLLESKSHKSFPLYIFVSFGIFFEKFLD